MQTVIGAFDDRSSAQKAVDRLHESGFDRKDVHLEQRDSTHDTSTTHTSRDDTGGWSFFKSLFGGDDHSSTHGSHYDEAVRRGHSVVVVDAHSDSEVERAASIMNALGAFDVGERSRQWTGAGSTTGVASGAAAGMPAGTAPGRVTPPSGTTAGTTTGHTGELKAGQEGVAQVVQEDVHVGKRVVDSGGVRVVQRVSQKPVHEVLRLREEHATVDRRKVDRPATEADLSNFREGTIEVRETTEEPVVAKSARVVEEVRVGKEVREREQTIDETVRRKDVDVQRIDGRRESAVAADKTTGTIPSKDKPTR